MKRKIIMFKARDETEANLCLHAKNLKQMGATTEEIHYQVDEALAELEEQIQRFGFPPLDPETGEEIE